MNFANFYLQAVDRRSFVDIMRLMFFVMCVVIYFGIICFCGDHLASRFDEVHGAIFAMAWNELPLDVQKLLPLMLNGTQTSNYIHGFMNVQCSREAFKKVSFYEAFEFYRLCFVHLKRKRTDINFSLQIINASFSYFTVLRGFSR